MKKIYLLELEGDCTLTTKEILKALQYKEDDIKLYLEKIIKFKSLQEYESQTIKKIKETSE